MKICTSNKHLKGTSFEDVRPGTVFTWVSAPNAGLVMKLENGGYCYLESGYYCGKCIDSAEIVVVNGCFVEEK